MKANLMVNNAKMKAELSLLEDTILQMLSASQGNILDDENLITTLAVSKVRVQLTYWLALKMLDIQQSRKCNQIHLAVTFNCVQYLPELLAFLWVCSSTNLLQRGSQCAGI